MTTLAGLIQPMSQFLKKELPVPQHLVEGLLPAGAGTTVLAGLPKSGKTLVAIDLFARLADGGKWLGRAVTQQPALYIFLEGQEFELQQRLRIIVGADEPAEGHFVVIRPDGFRLDLTSGRELLVAMIKATRPRVVIIDPLAYAHELDENDNSSMAPFLRGLGDLAHLNNVMLLLIHHVAKAGREGDQRSIRGAGAIAGSTEGNLILTENARGHRLHVQLRDGASDAVNLAFDPATLRFGVSANQAIDRPASSPTDRVLATVSSATKPLEIKEIAGASGLSDTSVASAVRELEVTGDIVRLGEKRGKAILYQRAA